MSNIYDEINGKHIARYVPRYCDVAAEMIIRFSEFKSIVDNLNDYIHIDCWKKG